MLCFMKFSKKSRKINAYFCFFSWVFFLGIKREFLNVRDLAEAVFFVLNKKISNSHINIGGTEHITIKKLANIIKKTTNFDGKIIFNKKYPDGVKERRLDVSLINKLGWKYKTKLKEGLKNYYKYFLTINKNLS